MAYFWRGLSTEGNLRFKIELASLIVGSKSTVLVLLYFIFEGNFPSTSPRGAYIWRGDFMEGFLRYRIGGLIFGGAYFRNFTVCQQKSPKRLFWLLLPDEICFISSSQEYLYTCIGLTHYK